MTALRTARVREGALSAGDRRALWLGVLVIAPIIAWRAIIAPYVTSIRSMRERVVTTRSLLVREQAVLRDAPLLPVRARRAAERAATLAPLLFSDADTVAATAALASWIRDAAHTAGVIVTQSEAAPVESPGDGVRSLGVDVRVEGPFSAVAVWLALLEQGERALSIERLDLIATGRSDGTIAASARVRGFSARLATMATGGAR